MPDLCRWLAERSIGYRSRLVRRDRDTMVSIAAPSAQRRAATSTDLLRPRAGDYWRIDFSRVEWQHEVVDGKYRKVAGTKKTTGLVTARHHRYARPERWGFVQFVAASATSDEYAQANFHPDPSLPTRDELMDVYHRQRRVTRPNINAGQPPLQNWAWPTPKSNSPLRTQVIARVCKRPSTLWRQWLRILPAWPTRQPSTGM